MSVYTLVTVDNGAFRVLNATSVSDTDRTVCQISLIRDEEGALVVKTRFAKGVVDVTDDDNRLRDTLEFMRGVLSLESSICFVDAREIRLTTLDDEQECGMALRELKADLLYEVCLTIGSKRLDAIWALNQGV